MAKTALFPENEVRLQVAKLMREIEEQFPNNVGFMLLQAARASKQCGCGGLSCPACGLIKLHQRVRRITNGGKITVGYLTGGPSK